MSVLSRLVLALAVASGVIAATSLPAHAGLIFANHCEPPRAGGAEAQSTRSW